MPRILLLITDLEIGGTPTVVRELALRLNDPPAVEIEVACLKRWGPVADQLRDRGIRVTALGATRAIGLFSVMRKLRQLATDRKFDVIFSFLVHANAVAALAARQLPPIRLIQAIQTTQRNPRWHWSVQRWAAIRADRIVVPSPSAAEVARRRAHVEAHKILIIPNAIDPQSFAPSPIPGQDQHPYPIGFIGRLDPVKRLVDLVQAAAMLGQSVHLHIFGDGSQRRLIAGLRSGNITWHRTIADPRAALAQIGLLVLPSRAEGFGLVLIEAMAAGVPVLGTNVPGIRDVVQDGVNGLLAEPFHPARLARAISRIINEPELRRHLIAGGYASVREKYSWSNVLPQYRRLLDMEKKGDIQNIASDT